MHMHVPDIYISLLKREREREMHGKIKREPFASINCMGQGKKSLTGV